MGDGGAKGRAAGMRSILVEHSKVRAEVLRHAGAQMSEDAVGVRGFLRYKFDNLVSSSQNSPFYMLALVMLICILLFGRLWKAVSDDPDETFLGGCWVAFQVIVASGIDSSANETGKVAVFICLLLCGMVIFAVLIGMITEAFADKIATITEGKTAIAASGHTLLLGWNETTMRTVCQIAFLRRQWRMLNSTFVRRWLRLGRVPASTPVAVQPVVVMCNSKTKGEMEEEIRAAFQDRGISPHRTRLGWDVICRVGDPSNIHDLARVGAARATSIMVQMTDEDEREEQVHGGSVQNGMTLRTLLALRHLLFVARKPPDWDNLRIVVQLAHPSKVMEAATFTAPSGRPVVFLQDLSLFLNNLMFACAVQPGLSGVLLSALSFEGAAMRARRADSFPDKGASIIGKAVADAVFAWEDTLLLGVIGGDGDAMQRDVVSPSEGIAPCPERVVKADDRVIFFGPSSVPTVLREPPPSVRKSEPSRRTSIFEAQKLNILVCGWRGQWDDPARLSFRLKNSLTRLVQGSHMTFMTHHSEEAFAALIERAAVPGLVRLGDGWLMDGCASIAHRHGDAVVVEELEPVVLERVYDRAVILSDMSLSAYSRDTRIMKVMLLLRFLQERAEQPAMSVVAENALNQTASMAIAPANRTGSVDPDFVNMQAIQARVLTQSLAYPKIEPAIRELFGCMPGGPEFVVAPMCDYAAPGARLTFHALQHMVKEVNAGDICIGWRAASGSLTICPRQGDVLTARADSTVILLSRRHRQAPGTAYV